MGYALLADLLALVHLLLVCFVIGGQIAIVVGAFRRWGWAMSQARKRPKEFRVRSLVERILASSAHSSSQSVLTR